MFKSKETEIDLIKVFNFIKLRYFNILKASIVFMIFSVLISLTEPNIFRSSTMILPQLNDQNLTNQTLNDLASFAGIDFGEKTNSNNISPIIYPEIINSISFQTNILNKNIIHNDVKISIKNYLLNHTKENKLISFINTLIDIPFLIYYNKNEEIKNNNDSRKKDIYIIDRSLKNAINILNEKLILNVNKLNGSVNLSFDDNNPEKSALILKL